MNRAGFYNFDLETVDRPRLRELQDERLHALLREIGDNQFYQEKFHIAGIPIEEIGTLEELKKIPFTTKSDLIAEQQTHPPYGRLLTYPITRYRYLHYIPTHKIARYKRGLGRMAALLGICL